MNAPVRIPFYDSFRNFVSMLATWKDKTAYNEPYLDVLDAQRLDRMYRGNWVCRKIVDLPAWDSCRAWRSWQADEDQIEKLEETERAFGIQRKLMAALQKARLYGGSAMVFGVEGTGDFTRELHLEDVEKDSLKFVHVVTGGRYQLITGGARVREVTSPWFGEPNYYLRSNSPVVPAPGGVEPIEETTLGYSPGETLYIHPSRVIRLLAWTIPSLRPRPTSGATVCCSRSTARCSRPLA